MYYKGKQGGKKSLDGGDEEGLLRCEARAPISHIYADTPCWYVSSPGLAPTDRADIIQLASSLIPFIHREWREAEVSGSQRSVANARYYQ